MLNVLLWVGAVLWAVFGLQALLNRLLLADLSRRAIGPRDDWPFVSIVVPARNEAHRIRESVTAFCTQDYPLHEVIVVDDDSTDATPTILAELSNEFGNLRVIKGREPPPGWLGKPNALETGRLEACGEWLLFVDADIVYGPQLLKRAIDYCLDHRLGMMACCPRLRTHGVFEAVLMSSLHICAFAIFPTFLVNVRSVKRYAAGGGAMNLVRRDAFEACGAFECLRDAIIDDIGLGYKVKQAGHALHMTLAGPLMDVRMYDGARAAIDGFSKNTFPAMRRRPWTMVVPFVLGMLVSLLPYVGFAYGLIVGPFSVPACISLVLMHVVLGAVCIWHRMRWYVAFLNPLRELGWWWILLRSAIRYYRHGLTWRGRNYGTLASQ